MSPFSGDDRGAVMAVTSGELSTSPAPECRRRTLTHEFLFLLVEREGLEPAGSLSQISNLLMTVDFLSPQFPSDPRFWHSICHWG
jgi:hypothetical protein